MRVALGVLASPASAWLLARMTCWALVLPVLKFVLPLPSLVRLMSGGSPRAPHDQERERRVIETARLLYRALGLVGKDNCLERSLVTYRFLARADAQPALAIGIRKEGARVIGHAWVTVRGEALAERRHSDGEFIPLIVFGADGTESSVGALSTSSSRAAG